MKNTKCAKRITALALILLTVAMLAVPVLAAASTVTDADFIESPSYGQLTKGEDYAYSFAVVGDTQSLNYSDVTTGERNLRKLYQWIIDNQSGKNIQCVLGLGDITDIVYRTAPEDLHDADYGEWENAKASVSLLDGKIPYSLTRGNHDDPVDFNATFGDGSYYYTALAQAAASGNAGFYPAYADEAKTVYKIDNTWQKIEVGSHKYLIMSLDYGQDAGVIAWANEVIAANPEYKVIVTTHQFLETNGSVTSSALSAGPFLAANSKTPSELWDQLLSKHANIMMVLSGHNPCDDIVTTRLVGDNGNTVTCMLIDPQHMDLVRDNFGGKVGMVAMLYFSEDGSDVRAEWISTVRATDGDDTTHAYLKDSNQFSLSVVQEWVKTDHGNVPKEIYENPAEHPFLLFQGGVYIGSNTQWATDGGAGAWVTARGKATAANPITILMRKDYAIASGGDKNVTHLNGNVIVDLGGNTLTTGSRQLFDLISKKANRKGNIEVFGGDIVISKNVLVDIRASANAGQSYTITFRDIDISFAEGTKMNSLVTDRANNASALFANTINFINCNIDFTNAASGGLAFDLDQETEYQKTDVVINGGSITVADNSAFTLATLAEGYDTVAFGRHEGKFTSFVLPAGSAMPTDVYYSVSGKALSFTDESNESNAVFTLEESAYVDDYGAIPKDYADEQEYPFALFYYYEDKENPSNSGYVFLNAYKWWANSSSADGGSNASPLGVLCQGVKYYLNNSKELDKDGNKITEVFVVLRRDYAVKTGVYNNLSQINGAFTLDLNGHTITTGSGELFKPVKKNNNCNTIITVENGTVLMGKTPVIAFGSDNRNTNNRYYDITFNDVKIGFAEGSTAVNVINTMVGTAYGNYCGKEKLTFNNCEFDLVTNAPAKTVTLFNIGADNDNHQVTVTVNGCTLKLGASFVFETIDTTDTVSKDTVSFGKGTDGNYLTFVLSDGAALPEFDFRTADGTALSPIGGDGRYTLSAHSHSYTATVTSPTCTEKGYTTYACSCGDSYIADETEALGHAYDNDFDADCNNCGEIREVELPTEGEVSRKIFWSFENGVLTVTGRGKIKNFSANTAPWCHLADQITKVVIGEGITYIGSSAFFGFTAIDTVNLPNSLTAIGRYAFYGCANLKNITIPENVTEIGAYAFRRSGLETIDFAIGYGWSAGDKEFSIADIISGGHRFISKSYYKQTWVRNTEAAVETLDPNYVAGGIMHTDVLWTLTTLENGKLKLTIFGNGMMADYGTACAPWYSYATDIVEIEVTEGVTYIGRCAFYGLKFVRTVTLPETLTAIGDYGFYMCRLMKEITIPESVTSIGKDAFVKTGLSEIPTV